MDLESYILWAKSEYGTSFGVNKKPLYGVGVNDAEYVTQSPSKKWFCPHYRAWSGVMRRCYDLKFKENRNSYKGCSVEESWNNFSGFLEWSLVNYVSGWELDKDILIKGNKKYSSTTCAYVPSYLNALLKQKIATTGELPIGVNFIGGQRKSPFQASCGESNKLGYFTSKFSAHKAWQVEKANQIENAVTRYMKEIHTNTKVAEALIARVWQLRLDSHLNKQTLSV